MKKLFSSVLAVLLALSCPVQGFGDDVWDLSTMAIANGTVQAVSHVDVTAPFSGTLDVFDLSAGDLVSAGDTLMRMVTTPLYATEDGVCRAVFAAVGDDASAVTARYGGIIGIEPDEAMQISATTAGAYNDDDNRTLRLGETLYFQSSKNNRVDGTGRVTSVSGQSYRVDVLTGSFELDESVTLYRDEDYETKQCVGKGVVGRRDSLLIASAGRVASLEVSEGETVKAGQLLARVIGADAAPGDTGDIVCPESGVISAVSAVPGQQVYRGQVLARIELDSELEVEADVDEMDLHSLKVGDTLPVTLDVNESNVLTGTVTEISALGASRQNAAYYTVCVSIPAGSALLGASASVYLPGK